MASAISVIVILVGGFVMLFGYGMISDCLSGFPDVPSDFCWDPRRSDSLFFYLGAIIVGLGAVMLLGGDFVRLLRKLRGGRTHAD